MHTTAQSYLSVGPLCFIHVIGCTVPLTKKKKLFIFLEVKTTVMWKIKKPVKDEKVANLWCENMHRKRDSEEKKHASDIANSS